MTLAVTRPAGAFFQKISAFPWLQREICRAATAVPGRHSTATLGRLKRTQRRHARPPSTPTQHRHAGSPGTANTPACPAQPRPHPAQRNAACLRRRFATSNQQRSGIDAECEAQPFRPVLLIPPASVAPDKYSLKHSISMIWEDNDRIRYVFLPDHGTTAWSCREMAAVAADRAGLLPSRGTGETDRTGPSRTGRI